MSEIYPADKIVVRLGQLTLIFLSDRTTIVEQPEEHLDPENQF